MAAYEALLLDLDGTVFGGKAPIIGARETLARAEIPQFFVTNNASRRPVDVADHLNELGFDAEPEQVVTSAQSGAQLLAEHLEPGSRALVVGSEDSRRRFARWASVSPAVPTTSRTPLSGYSPHRVGGTVGGRTRAIRAGALWVATNIDATLPSERGLLVGNGSLVAAVANATGQSPLVAGKPAAPLMVDAIRRSGVNKPLVCGRPSRHRHRRCAHSRTRQPARPDRGQHRTRPARGAARATSTYVTADLRVCICLPTWLRSPARWLGVEIDGDTITGEVRRRSAESLLPSPSGRGLGLERDHRSRIAQDLRCRRHRERTVGAARSRRVG